jgi:hypothetical protein
MKEKSKASHIRVPQIKNCHSETIKIRTQEDEPYLFFFKKKKVVEYVIYDDGFMGVDYQRIKCPRGEFHMGGCDMSKRGTVQFLLDYHQGDLLGDQSILEMRCSG